MQFRVARVGAQPAALEFDRKINTPTFVILDSLLNEGDGVVDAIEPQQDQRFVDGLHVLALSEFFQLGQAFQGLRRTAGETMTESGHRDDAGVVRKDPGGLCEFTQRPLDIPACQ